MIATDLYQDFGTDPGAGARAAPSTSDEFEEAKALGIVTRPVIVGPATYVLIGKEKYDSFDPDNLSKNENHWKSVVLEYEKLFYYYISEIF